MKRKIEKEKAGVYAFPNPAKGRFEIRFKKYDVQQFDLLVVDNTGRTGSQEILYRWITVHQFIIPGSRYLLLLCNIQYHH